MSKDISIALYNPLWPKQFKEARIKIMEVLSANVIAVRQQCTDNFEQAQY